jgi:hypothetical protein
VSDPAEHPTAHLPSGQTPPPASGGPWAAPAAPPFGSPAAPRGAQGPQGSPGRYAPPAGYALPDFRAAPAPSGGGRSGLGLVALILALVAAVGASIAVAVAAFNIGLGAGTGMALRPMGADFDWSVLAPVRGWVLLGEISFWLGTALGIWALVQGIIAVVQRRGRAAGIAAIVIAALGPIVFGVVLQGFLTAGLAAGSSIGG